AGTKNSLKEERAMTMMFKRWVYDDGGRIALQIVRIAQALRPMLILWRGRTVEILRRPISGTRCVSSPLLGFLRLESAHAFAVLVNHGLSLLQQFLQSRINDSDIGRQSFFRQTSHHTTRHTARVVRSRWQAPLAEHQLHLASAESRKVFPSHRILI